MLLYHASILFHAVLALAATLDILDGIRTTYRLPALAVGIVNPNRTIQAQAAGFRKYGTSVNATAYDQYHLGSITKTMTATLIAQYIEEGNLTWESTLEEVLPQWRERMEEPYRNVTIAQLASHHSGFTDRNPPIGTTAVFRNASAVDGRLLFVEEAFRIPPTSPPERDSYSNQNYIILGFIIDTLFGPWEQQIQERLWTPLNMTECRFGNFPEPNSTAIEGIWPHAQGSPEPVPLPPTWDNENARLYGPAGTARCSPRSYAKFLALHLDGASGRNTSVLTASSFPRLHTPYRTDGGSMYTAGGWVAFSSDDPRLGAYLGHDGSNTLNYASGMVVPRLDAALFALTNVASPDPATSDAQKGVASALQRAFDGEFSGLPVVENGTATSNGTGLMGTGEGSVENGVDRLAGGRTCFTIMILMLTLHLSL